MSWIRIGNHIAIEEGTYIAHLEAEDVYDTMQGTPPIVNGSVQQPLDEAFPKLFFSPVSCEAHIKLTTIEKNIYFKVVAGEAQVDFVKGNLLDQVIDGDEWHYISNAEELRTAFGKLRIFDNGIISISQYIDLLKWDFGSDYIDNAVDSQSLQIGLDFSKPDGLCANLYEYQKQGFTWMDFMLENSHGCILGDEMGLGKTLQAIALIQKRKNQGKQCLVVAPVSLLNNWEKECSKFAPELNVLIHHGSKRTGSPMGLDGYDLIVTSYGHAVSDNLLLCMRSWDLIILDEAQSIKNPHSSRTKRIKDIPAKERLAVTGTPFENHVTDVWSIIDFIMPNYLGSEASFKLAISDDLTGAKKLEPILSSVMVRRLVKDVAQDLPEKVVISQPLSMSDIESEGYEAIRQDISGKDAINFASLQKLRMYCTHPKLCDDTSENSSRLETIKYQRMCEILEEVFLRNEKAIIFTSYQDMFEILKEDLPKRFNIPVDCINGSTPVDNRQKIVDWFNELYGSAVLILNPRAAGTGLNITSANHVIHYNLEWNPAVEDQASARAYRRGQEKITFIYRLYYSNTVEDIINQRLDRKRSMAETAVIGSSGEEADMQDIIDSLNISPKGI